MSSLADRQVYEVGKFYRVPCVYMRWSVDRRHRWWPVIGDWHEDAEFLKFDSHHIHIDARFVTPRHKAASRRRDILCRMVNTPIQRNREKLTHYKSRPNSDTSPPLVGYQWRKCVRAEFTLLEVGDNGELPWWMADLEDHYQDVELKQAVCPHKGAPLNGPTDEQGCVTCPLHGLRFRESDGRLVRHTETRRANPVADAASVRDETSPSDAGSVRHATRKESNASSVQEDQ